jgi:hypothetical protein
MSIHQLAFDGSTVALRAVLSCQPAHVTELSPDRGSSLLYTAARFNHLAVCQMLVEEFHADVNIRNKENLSTPLHGAAFGGHAAIVEYLISHGANIGALNAYHETPLDNAKAPAEGVKKVNAKNTITALTSTKVASAATIPVVPAAAAPVVVHATPCPKDPPPQVSSPSQSSLMKLTLPTLVALCVQYSLSSIGTKADLIKRLTPAIAAGPPAATAVQEEPPTKKIVVESSSGAPVAVPLAAPVAVPLAAPPVVADAAVPPPSSSPVATLTTSVRSVDDPAWIAKLASATYTETEVVLHTQEFWDLEEKVNAWYQGRNEDYVSNRLKKKKKPLTFVLKRAWKIHNPVLEQAFAETRKLMQSTLDDGQCRVRVAFHGTREVNIPSILRTGLLRFKHPLNPCTTQADDGYFGTNLKGVYVSRYYDYTLKYCNGLNPLDDGAVAKTIMFKCLPGKVFPIPKLSMGIQPTPGYNSHSSPNNLEWYLFDECQACPEYIVEMKAQEDTRTAADDE